MADNSSPLTAANYSESLLRLANANVGFLIGCAEAARTGYQTLLDSLDEKNVARLDFDNGFLQGTVKGWSKSMEQLPKLTERYYETLAGKSKTAKPHSASPKKTSPAKHPAHK